MGEESRKDVVRGMLEVFNSGRLDRIDDLVSPAMVSHNPHPGTSGDREGLKDQIRDLRSSFPNAVFAEERMIADGDRVFLRWKMTATHDSDYMGHAPTGREITHYGNECFVVRGGLIHEHYGEESNLELMAKLTEAPSAS